MRCRPALRMYLFLMPILLLAAACSDDDDPVAPQIAEPSGPLQFDTYQAADVVIGQIDGESTSGNGMVGPSPWTMYEPSGLAVTGDGICIADRNNRRLLVYRDVPEQDGMPAAYAVGQVAMTTDEEAIGAARFSVFDCDVADGRLFVADEFANRVLIWNTIPQGDEPADVVLGQETFGGIGSSLSDSTLSSPSRVRAAGGRLFVLDTGNARCLIWNSIPDENGAPADVVVGASDFTTFEGDASRSEFGFGIGLWTDGERLAISDGTNSRVLIWNTIPTTNGAPADVVVGASDFETVDNEPQNGPGNPTGLASDGNSLFVLDSTYHRLLVYTPFPTGNGQLPSAVLGQPDLASVLPNHDADTTAASRRVFNGPLGVRVVGRQLLVADTGNNRVLVFHSR